MMRSKMRYAVVSFDDTDETDYLPLTWMTDKSASLDVKSLVVSRSTVTFYWPPWRSGTRLSRAKKVCMEPETGWPQYTCRILATAGNFLTSQFPTDIKVCFQSIE